MPRKQKKGYSPSALEEDLLIALLGEDLYGLELLEKVNQARNKVGMKELGIGSLYPCLKRMEEAKLIRGEFRERVAGQDSPRRKYYKLLGLGETAINRAQAYRRLLRAEKIAIPEGGKAY